MRLFYQREDITLYQGNVVSDSIDLPDKSVNTIVTSPPYWGLRDYGEEGQLGQEKTPEEYVEKLVDMFRKIKRILRDDGTVWLNLGDSYAQSEGSGTGEYQKRHKQFGKIIEGGTVQEPRSAPIGLKPKDLVGIPWRVAFALQADGWYLRQDIIWNKPNPMPESVRDRCTKSHEYIFLLSKSVKYYYNYEAIAESIVTRNEVKYAGNKSGLNSSKSYAKSGKSTRRYSKNKHKNLQRKDPHSFHVARIHGNIPGRDDGGNACNNPDQIYRNKRSVWTITTKSYSEAHFATFPLALIEPCILAGCPSGGTVLDPFSGSGTTGFVARKYGRQYIGIDLKEEYLKMSQRRIFEDQSEGYNKQELSENLSNFTL